MPAIKDIIDQYLFVLQTPEELAAKATSVSARAYGLAQQLHSGSTLLGLSFALQVLQPLETLNRALQGRTTTVAGMLEAVDIVTADLLSKHDPAVFEDLLSSVDRRIDELNLEAVSLPRRRQPPARLTGSAAAFQATSIFEYYMPAFFELIDSTTADRFRFMVVLRRYLYLAASLNQPLRSSIGIQN